MATALAAAAVASPAMAPGASAHRGVVPAPAAEHYVDLRSPDARDAARDAPAAESYVDLRSPDARDAGNLPTASPAVVDAPSPSDGFDMASAAIGAAAGTGLVLVLLAAGALTRRRRPLTRRHGTAGA